MNEPTNKKESNRRAKKKEASWKAEKKQQKNKKIKGMTNIRKERDSCGRCSNWTRGGPKWTEKERKNNHILKVHYCYASQAK